MSENVDAFTLSAEEAQALGEVRLSLGGNAGERHDDLTLLRFLRAHGGNVHQAAAAVDTDQLWRRQQGLDTTQLDEHFAQRCSRFQELSAYWPGRLLGADRRGLPVFYERVGLADFAGLFSVVPEKELVDFHIYLMESHVRRERQYIQRGAFPQGLLLVEDVGGLGWKHFLPKAFSYLKTIQTIDAQHYPGVFRKVFIVNAPFIFASFWSAISPLLDRHIRDRVEVLGGDFRAQLENEIDWDHLPHWLGGGQVVDAFPTGGPFVAGSTSADRGGNSSSSHDRAGLSSSSAVVPAGLMFDVPLSVDHDNTVVGWSFTTDGYDVAFGVLRQLPSGALEEAFPLTRCDSHLAPFEGRVVAHAGQYLLRWDNSYSVWRKKHLQYSLFVEPPAAQSPPAAAPAAAPAPLPSAAELPSPPLSLPHAPVESDSQQQEQQQHDRMEVDLHPQQHPDAPDAASSDSADAPDAPRPMQRSASSPKMSLAQKAAERELHRQHVKRMEEEDPLPPPLPLEQPLHQAASPDLSAIQRNKKLRETTPPPTPPPTVGYTSVRDVGIAEETNRRFRRTMEDAHVMVDNFGEDPSCGFFGVYDGHGGKQAADFAALHLHKNLLIELNGVAQENISDAILKAYLKTDEQIKLHNITAGTTAVSALITTAPQNTSLITETLTNENRLSPIANDRASILRPEETPSFESSEAAAPPVDASLSSTADSGSGSSSSSSSSSSVQRWLYIANCGDARAVLDRNGTAVRLSYDHKATDEAETKRIHDAGGFVIMKRVSGVLAVTRALGDHSMKEHVVGLPFMSRTELRPTDRLLILACDGLWDVVSDQEAIDMVRDEPDAQRMSEILLAQALQKGSTDNISVMTILL